MPFFPCEERREKRGVKATRCHPVFRRPPDGVLKRAPLTVGSRGVFDSRPTRRTVLPLKPRGSLSAKGPPLCAAKFKSTVFRVGVMLF